MSYYDDEEPRRHKSRRHRPTYEEEVIETRTGRNNRNINRHTEIIPRPRDSSMSSVEEVQRDYLPGGGEYVRRKTTVKDKYGRARSVDRSDYYSGGRRKGNQLTFPLYTSIMTNLFFD